jgi:hypothetical protein
MSNRSNSFTEMGATVQRSRPRFEQRLLSCALILAAAMSGCEDDPEETAPHDRDGHEHDAGAGEGSAGEGGSGGSGGTGGSASKDGVYAYVRGNFVNLAKTTDLLDDAAELDPAKAREFENEPFFVGGAAVDQTEFELRQYKVGDDLTWGDGPKLNFSQYPFGEDGVSWFFSWQVDEHHMYFNYDLTSRVVWDPTDFKILTSVEDSEIPLKLDDLTIEPAGNRSALKAGMQQVPYFWKDEAWWKFADKSVIALYDRETHEESKLIEVGCPGLAVGTRDEDGNTYWGTWDYKGIAHLYGQGAKPCIARITPEGELDEDFTTDLLDLTGGKYGKNFTYVRDGWGLYMVFDHEKTGLDFTKEPDANGGVEKNPFDRWWDATFWTVYKVDLKNKKAEVFEPLKDTMVLEYVVERVDDRVFIGVGYAETWDSTKTAGDQWDEVAKWRVEELQEDDSTEVFSREGDGKGRWVRIR